VDIGKKLSQMSVRDRLQQLAVRERVLNPTSLDTDKAILFDMCSS